ncbi:MAG: hypothetical protein KDB00_23990, partial [Planctomycetales bacterium]|nr:hypothetical protein [Planctomycetales bacterium]
DITPSPKYPDYVAAKGIVLVRAMSPQTNDNQANDAKVNSAGKSSQKPSALSPSMQALLDWSAPVDGLRAAVMIQTQNQQQEQTNYPKVLLVLQNVSDKNIRICDTQMKKNDDVRIREDKRTLYLHDKVKGILSGHSSSGGTDTDVELKPNQVVMLDIFHGEVPSDKGFTLSAALVDVLLHNGSMLFSASLNLNTAPPNAWSGKLTTPPTRGAVLAKGPLPNDMKSRELFQVFLDHARHNGDIPGGMIKRLEEKVQYFISINTGDQSGDPYAKKMQRVTTRFEKDGDWTQADVVSLLDEIAAVTTIPMDTTLDTIREETLNRGQLLPSSLKNANWGQALPGGLRMAWILEPVADRYHLGSSLNSRVVIHNSGEEPVAFKIINFQQPKHSATNGSGAAIELESTYWTTRGLPKSYRLHPGEYCEVHAPGIGIGRRNNDQDDWANVRPGTWILANEGDDVVFQAGEILLTGDYNQKVDSDWWLKSLTQRLRMDAPLPANEAERKLILFRAVQDLFGTSPRPNEAESFYADKSPEALENLAKLLSKRSWITPVSGSIKSGVTKFRVLPRDPDAANRPRVASNPGRYNLADTLRLVVTRRPYGSRIVNEANLMWFPKGENSVSTPVSLPDGYNTWAAGWIPETTDLWIATKDSLRRYDFSNLASIQVQPFDGDQQSTAPVPNELREQLNGIIVGGETPRPTIGPVASSADSKSD